MWGALMFTLKGNWKNFWQKYRHIFPVLLYFIFYLAVFAYIENRPSHYMHFLVSRWDRLIPFCEYFIVPYILWFFYVAFGVLYLGLAVRDRSHYWSLATSLCIGMTLFLIVSLVYPNGHSLRPLYMRHDNIFTDMVKILYRIDTSTNVLPSIHVFNSVAVHIALASCPSFKKHQWAVHASFILCVLIIASTMFLKQHTVIDVITALALNVGCYCLVYQPNMAGRQVPRSTAGRRLN